MGSERCWGERCRKAVCGSPRHPKPRSSASSHPGQKEAASASVGAIAPILRGRNGQLTGHAYERANICAECGGPLAASDGHYHSRSIWGSAGAEPICCKHSPKKCYIDPLAHFKGYGVTYYPAEKGELAGEVEDSEEADDNQEFMEEQDVSKTSQNQKVQEEMKGQKAAKAAKAPKEPKVAKPKKEKIPYEFKPLAKSFKGVAGKATMEGKVLGHVPFHSVSDGETACGYDVTEPSKGMTGYELNWVSVKEAVSCGRCIKALNPKPKAEKPAKAAKEPTPIKAAKAKKEAAAATS